jgi:hypothetical protein
MGSAFLANVLASYCRATGRLTDAVAVGTESSDLWEQIIRANPSANHVGKITFNNFALTNALIREDVSYLRKHPKHRFLIFPYQDPKRALVVAQQAVKGLGRGCRCARAQEAARHTHLGASSNRKQEFTRKPLG